MHSKADETFYLTASRILELANKASELFESSEDQEKRQLLQFVLQKTELKGKLLDFSMKKPFDILLESSKTKDWLPLVNAFKNREIEFGFSLQNIQTVFDTFQIQPTYA